MEGKELGGVRVCSRGEECVGEEKGIYWVREWKGREGSVGEGRSRQAEVKRYEDKIRES